MDRAGAPSAASRGTRNQKECTESVEMNSRLSLLPPFLCRELALGAEERPFRGCPSLLPLLPVPCLFAFLLPSTSTRSRAGFSQTSRAATEFLGSLSSPSLLLHVQEHQGGRQQRRDQDRSRGRVLEEQDGQERLPARRGGRPVDCGAPPTCSAFAPPGRPSSPATPSSITRISSNALI